MASMWMVRAEGGQFYDAFRDRGVVAIGWAEFAMVASPGMSRRQLVELYRDARPNAKMGTAVSGASQVWRFLNEIAPGDLVATYSPANRTYMIGSITGQPEHHPEWADEHMILARSVAWRGREVPRDELESTTKNSLGSTLTVFKIPEHAARDLLARQEGKELAVEGSKDLDLVDGGGEEDALDPFENIQEQALEQIKDRVSALDWSDMQELVAGILRAMGYKTQVSPPGSDRGRDVIASPDGFGFENPRIVVEVKHRSGAMGSQAIRSFLGGRHKDDRGLYVSTGGFSRDAHYEADRAAIPLVLWTLDNLVRALVDHYDDTDAETKRLVPLKRMYWPA